MSIERVACVLASFCLMMASVSSNPAGVLPLDSADAYIPTDVSQCPYEGVFGYPHPKECDQYILCVNGSSLTHEFCPNGLLFSQTGHVVGMCAYSWNVDCQGRNIPKPISTPGCPYQFGFFAESADPCNVYYSECAWGVPSRRVCEPHGLFYDDRIKGCNWPDQVGCSSEKLLGFKCPAEDTHNRYWPYPRYYHNQQSIINCVDGQPRLINCPADEVVDAESLTCQAVYKEEEATLVAPKVAPKLRRF